jgi:ATP-dependent DNA helicase DinG
VDPQRNTSSAELSVSDVLGPGGSVARRLGNYEVRPQQLEMSRAVEQALASKQHLIVEAGTGTGKSFAYLVPAILHASADRDTGDREQNPRRVVVSTHTISLQEQLISKDLPLLNAVIPREFSAILVKGRQNYISLRRLKNANSRSLNLFHDPDQVDELRDITAWARQTNDGSLADLRFRPNSNVWDEVASDSGNCLGKKCESYASCFYYQARRRAKNAQLLIVNHALFFSDLALRQSDARILPNYDAVIFDEAHTIENVASEHLGIRLSSGQVEYLLNKLYNDRTNRGLLVHQHLAKAQQQVVRCREAARDLFGDLAKWMESRPDTFNGCVKQPEIVPNGLGPELQRLSELIDGYGKTVKDESLRMDYMSASEKLVDLHSELECWRLQRIPDAVYWIERPESRRGARIVLAAAPIDVGPILREQLFQKTNSVIMTSATLSVGRQASFEFFQSRIGATQHASLKLGSPFNYRQQARIIVVRGMPDPNDEPADFERLCSAMIFRYVKRTNGHALALFTSYAMLGKVAARLAADLRSAGIGLFSQGDGTPRGHLLDQFKSSPRSVLLGTDSFWQGVDVPGEALQNVIITKLPFMVPDQPLLQARMDAIRKAGGNPFRDYQLPQAVIKLRQGFGRLIRTQQDRGIVVILDPRIYSKPYGRMFIESLPECEVVDESVGGVED